MNTLQLRIEPTEGKPEPLPPVGGQWIRDEDGGLRPADKATADAAGLGWPEDAAAAVAEPSSEPEGKKRPR